MSDELLSVKKNFYDSDIEFQECDCDENFATCVMRGIRGVPVFDFVDKINFFIYETTPIHGKFNAEELTDIVANISGIQPTHNFSRVIYGDKKTVQRNTFAGKCVLAGNVNGVYGSKLRSVVDDLTSSEIVSISDAGGLFTINTEDDVPLSYFHYFDRVFNINMTKPVELIVGTIRTLCFSYFRQNDIKFINALLKGEKDAESDLFKDKSVSDDMIKFAQNMSHLSMAELKQKLRKLQKCVIENDLSENVSKRLSRRIHILNCLIRYIAL